MFRAFFQAALKPFRAIYGWFQFKDAQADALDGILAAYSASTLDSSAIDARIQTLRLTSNQEPAAMAVLCELELLRLRRCNDADLLQAIPELRRQFTLLSSKAPVFSKLDAPPGNALARTPDPCLLAEASFLTIQIMRRHDLQETFASIKTVSVFRIAIPVLLAFPLAWLIDRKLSRDPTVFIVMIVGVCGGFVSLCARIYQRTPGPDLVSACRLLRADLSGLVVKPVLGGAFALCLYLLFIAGMVKGSLFPALEFGMAEKGAGFRAFFSATVTAPAAEFAKLLVWCFIAGFAERFVPDILDRLAAKVSTDTINEDATPRPTE